MKPIKFKEQNITYGEDQPEYESLPAYRDPHDMKGTIITCWKLTDAEIKQITETGVIWNSVMTFHDPLHPQLLSTESPFIWTGMGNEEGS